MIEQDPVPFPNTLIVSYLDQVYYIDMDRNPNALEDFNRCKTPEFAANSVVKANMDFYIFGINADDKIKKLSTQITAFAHSKPLISSLFKQNQHEHIRSPNAPKI